MMNLKMDVKARNRNRKDAWLKVAGLLTIAGACTLPLAWNQNLEAQGGPVNPLAQPAKDAWVNSFKGEDIALKLMAGPQEGQYTGTLTFKGQAYPVTAKKVADGSISGQFVVQGNAFPFTASYRGDTVKLVSSGTEYTLKSPQKPQPKNPLAGPEKPKPENPLTNDGDKDQPKVTFENQKTFKHATGYQFNYPGSWTVQDTQSGISISPDDMVAGKEFYVISSAPAQGISGLDDPKLVAFFDNVIKQSAPNAKRSGQLTKKGNLGVLVYKATNPQTNENFVQLYYIQLRDGFIFALGATAREDLIGKREEPMYQLFSTFTKGEGKQVNEEVDEVEVAPGGKFFANGKVFKHSTGYTFEYPPTWTLQENAQNIVITPADVVKSNGQAQEQFFIGLDDAQGAKSVNDPKIVQYADTQMKQQIPGIQRLGQLQTVGDVGILTYQFGNQAQTFIMRIRFKLVDGKTVNLVSLSRSDLADKRSATLLKMIQSVSKGKVELDQSLKGSWYRENTGGTDGITGKSYTASQEYIILSADGSATRKSRGMISVTLPDGAGAGTWDKEWNTMQGNWSAANGKVIISWNDGKVFTAAYQVFMHDGAPAVQLTLPGSTQPLYYKKTG